MKKKAQVWIFARESDGSLSCLLLRTNAKRGNFWQPVTGGAESGEDFEQAALREAQEETGLEFCGAPINTGYSFHFLSRHGKDIEEQVFALLAEDKAPPELDPSEHDDYLWVPVQDAASQVKFESNVEGLKQALLSLKKHPQL